MTESPSVFEGLKASWIRYRGLWIAVLVLAAGLRVSVWADIAALPTAEVLVEDARQYDADAQALIATGGVPPAVFYQAPAYPYFLASVYKLAGRSFEAVRAVQWAMSLLTVVLLAATAARLGGRRAALVTATLAGALAPMLLYVPLLLKPTLLIALETLFLFMMLAAARRRAPSWRWVLAGCLLGLCVLLRGNLLLLVPAALVWIVQREGPGWPRPALMLVGGLAAAILPVTVVNHSVSGQWVLTSSQSGSNFYIGNHRGAPGYYVPLFPGRQGPEHERVDAERFAAELIARETGAVPESVSGSEMSRAFWREAGRQIRDAPGSWLVLMAKKALFYWNDYEIPDAEDLSVYREKSRALRWSPVGFGAVAVLGLLGLWWRRTDSEGSLLVCLTAASWLSVVLFYVFGRYRLPVVAFLLPAAGFGAVELWDRLLAPRRHAWALLTAGLMGLLCLAYWPVLPRDQRARLSVAPRVNLGTAGLRVAEARAASAGESGDRELLLEAIDTARAATAELERAVAIDSDFTPAGVHLGLAHSRLGNYVLQAGDPAAALELYALAESWLARALAGPGAARHQALVAEAEELFAILATSRCLAREGLAARLLAEGGPQQALAAAEGCDSPVLDYLRAVALRELARREDRPALLAEALTCARRAAAVADAPRPWLVLRVELERATRQQPPG